MSTPFPALWALDGRTPAIWPKLPLSPVRQRTRLPALNTLPSEPVPVKGALPLRPYYTPRDRNGTPVSILKVKPKTSDACTQCGLCAEVCPMGAISREDAAQVPGICIKCCACVKKCPVGAKYYDDEGYLYHQHELEALYAGRRWNRSGSSDFPLSITEPPPLAVNWIGLARGLFRL